MTDDAIIQTLHAIRERIGNVERMLRLLLRAELGRQRHRARRASTPVARAEAEQFCREIEQELGR